MLESLRRRAVAEGLPVYLVGGPVRDALLHVPVKDLDFVLEGAAPALAGELANELGGFLTVHPRFGTATVEVQGDRVDIVTARKEAYPFPGSLPEVSPSSLEADLARRDFSINAMALPLSVDEPLVIDFHGGVRDLEDQTIRTLHPGSFTDDPTRMLRAVRYQQRLGFELAESTAAELKGALAGGHVSAVTGDRWRQELQRIFEEDRAAGMLLQAIDLGVLPAIHPALSDGQHLMRLAEESGVASEPANHLAALAASLSPADGDSASRRLNLPGPWARVVRDTIAVRGILAEITPSPAGHPVQPSTVCRLLNGMDLHVITAMTRFWPDPQVVGQLEKYLAEWMQITPELTGGDLLAMGVPRGPGLGEALRELAAAKQDGLAATVEAERDLVKQIISRGS
ncbi:MAG: CCA tRNA nucleotidyltransferase [Chloroflexi bacterium]|nr:CCA tRNA nucleotidyltransferase [Chloroflexota bacterium]